MSAVTLTEDMADLAADSAPAAKPAEAKPAPAPLTKDEDGRFVRTTLGIKLNAEVNNVRGTEVVISTADSPIKVMVVPTNEELVIARDTRDIVAAR